MTPTTPPPASGPPSARARLDVLAVLLRSASRLITGAPRFFLFLLLHRGEQRRTAQIVLGRDDVGGHGRPGAPPPPGGPAG